MEFIAGASTQDSGLVIETKEEQERFLKKGFSSLPQPRINVKLPGRMGVGAEQWRASRNILVMPKEKTTIVEEEIVDIFQEGTYDIPLNESSHDTNKNITGKIEPKFKSSNVINQRNREKQSNNNKPLVLTDATFNKQQKTVISGRIIPEIAISDDDNDLKKWIIRNGPYALNLYNLFSLELIVHKSLQYRLTTAAPSFVCGWLYDEVIDSYLHQLCSPYPSILFCDSTLVQCIENGKSIRNLWKNINLKDVALILVPVNPTGNHWVLAALKPKIKTIVILDPMSGEIRQSSSTFKQCFLVSRRIFEEKFSIEDPIFTLNTPHVLQKDLKSCGVLVCFYSLCLTKGKRLFHLIVTIHRRKHSVVLSVFILLFLLKIWKTNS